MKIGIVDYGAGNVRSVMNAFTLLGEDPIVVHRPEEIGQADRLVLPGVGAAGEAMARLRQSGLDQALDETVRRKGRPLLGICLGMQLLADRLLEFGEHKGLGWIDGEVVDIRACTDAPDLRVPHMGWNQVAPAPAGRDIFDAIMGSHEFYFAHSFTLRTDDADVVAARTSYGTDLVAAVCKDTVFATQFHPEKSQVSGERLLSAFLEWNP